MGLFVFLFFGKCLSEFLGQCKHMIETFLQIEKKNDTARNVFFRLAKPRRRRDARDTLC